MSNPWFRMYSDFLEDPKIISLAFEDQRHFIGILALKSTGVLDQDCDEKIRDRIAAQRLWIDYAIISDVKKRLVDAGLVENDWQPVAWSKRQFVSDKDPTNADRQKRHRERNALRNAPVTHLDTDTDTDKKENLKPLFDESNEGGDQSLPFDIPTASQEPKRSAFDDLWEAFGDNRGKANAKKAWVKLNPDAKLALVIIEAAKRYAVYRNAVLLPSGGTPKMAEGWLSSRRWEDELPAMKYTERQIALIDAYNASIGDALPKANPDDWTSKRAALLDAAMAKWGAEKWAGFFRYIGEQCSFDFPADLFWLLVPDNFMKAKAGNYQKGVKNV